MTDNRLSKFRQAADRMRRGDFDVEIPTEGQGEIARLGESLQALAKDLEARFDEAANLAKITERVNAGMVVDEVLNHVYESFGSVIPFDRIGLALLENEGRTVRAHWSRSEALETKLGVGYSAELAGSSLDRIIGSGRPRILNDLDAYLAQHPESDSTRLIVAEGIRSSLTCPLVALGRPIGFLFFSSREKDTYQSLHQGYFLQLANQISVILEKSRLYEKLLILNRRLQDMQSALEYEASHDALTGLWNRRSILRLLEQEISRAERSQQSLAAVILDLDYFKETNDEHGHLVGDQVLEELSRRLLSSVRTAEFVGRLGGEEFLLVLCPCDESTVARVMERIRIACGEAPFQTSAGNLEVTVSLGAATLASFDGIGVSAMLAAADRAMYRAKEGGRNRWELESVPTS